MNITIMPEDSEYLIRAIAQNFADSSYAAQVGIAAVVLNRVEDERYPDTAAGVVSSWDKFPINSTAVIDEQTYRVAADAFYTAAAGADPTSNSLTFDLPPTSPPYTAIINNIGFK